MNTDREAVIKIMDFLKGTRDFFTIPQLETATSIRIEKGTNLMALLQKHSHIVWRKEKLRFKVPFEFRNAEGFLDFLREQPDQAIIENDELRFSYDEFQSDLKKLHALRKVFIIDPESTKRNKEDKGRNLSPIVIYLNSMPDVPLAQKELRELWQGLDEIKKDMTELRNRLTDKEIKVANMTLDVQLMLQGKKKAKARSQAKRGEKKRKANQQLNGVDFSAITGLPAPTATY